MAKYAFFLGCIAPLRYPGIEKSTREVCAALGVELVDLQDASCCPAPGVIRAFSKKTWLAAAARNLALAEQQGLPILTICNGCYGSLFDAAHELAHDEKLLAEVNEILKECMREINIELIDFKLEFGRYHGEILLADEVSPDTCRFWDARTHEPLDIDRFRHDLGDVEEGYREVLHRLTGNVLKNTEEE